MLIKVYESVVLEVNNIKDSMRPSGSSIINGKEHKMFVGNNLIKERVIESEVTFGVRSVGTFEEM